MVAVVATLLSTVVMAAPPGGEGIKWTLQAADPDDNITAVRVTGTPTEMGWWYGNLLATEIRDTLTKGFQWAEDGAEGELGLTVGEFYFMIDYIIWPRMVPHIPQAFLDEMQGIVDGAGQADPPVSPAITLTDLIRYHVIVELAEFNCTSIGAVGNATHDGRLIQIRVLDFSMNTGCQDNPVITVYRPTEGPAYCNVGFAGLIGSLAGISSERIAVCEVGLSTPGAGLDSLGMLQGIPMTLLLKKVLAQSVPDGGQSALDKATQIILDGPRTSNYGYGVGDGTIRDTKSFVTTRSECYVWGTNELMSFNDANVPGTIVHPSLSQSVTLPAVDGATYLPHNETLSYSLLTDPNYVPLTPAKAIEVARRVAMNNTNLMDVVFDGEDLKLWVAFAEGENIDAADREFVEFDFRAQLPAIKPTPMTFSQAPQATGPTGVTMQATEAQARSGPVRYYFEQVGGGDSGWQSSRTYTVADLTPNTQYGYRVKASDASDPPNETDFSASEQVRTLAAVPAAPDLSEPTWETVVLALDDDDNPAGTEYAIYDSTRATYLDASGAASASPVWRNRTAWGQLAVTDLAAETEYQFACKARNADSIETTLSPTATIQTLPNLALILVVENATPTTVDISLTPDPNTPATTTYAIFNVTQQVWLAQDGTAHPTPKWYTAGEWGTLTVGSLQPDTNYEFQVKAKDPEGVETDMSDGVSIYTLANSPLRLVVGEITTTTVRVAIDPNDGNPVTTVYAVRNVTDQRWLDLNGLGYDDPVWRTAGEWGDLKITALSPGTEYDFDCHVRSGSGSTTLTSDTVKVVTLPTSPEKPVIGGASAKTVSLSISPTDDNSDTVEYAIRDTTRNVWIAQDGSVSDEPEWHTRAGWGTVVAGDLYPDTEYSFHVKARNADGHETEPSDVATVLTLADEPKMPVVGNPTASSLDVTIADDDNTESTTYAIYDQKRAVWLTPGGMVQLAQAWHTAEEWGTVTVISLGLGIEYSFVVRARNDDRVETADSPPGKATTLTSDNPVDPNNVTFDPVTFASPPSASSSSVVVMRASINGNVPVPPTRYYFKETTGNYGGTDSGWVTNPLYSDTGLMADTVYGYQVKARDSATPPNVTPYSQVSAVCTPARIPLSPEIRSKTRTSLTVRLDSGGNPAHTRMAVYDQTREMYIAADGGTSDSPVWQTKDEWGLVTITGLDEANEYLLTCKAINQENVATVFGQVVGAFTLPPDQTPPSLTELAIQGPSELDEGSVATYALSGTYSNGSVAEVSAGVTWRLSTSQWGVITGQGVLHAHQVPADKEIIVHADVTDGGRIVTAEVLVTILDVSEAVDPNVTDPNDIEPVPAARDFPGVFCPTTSLTILLAMVGGVLVLRRRAV